MVPRVIIKHGKLLEPFFKTYVAQNYPDFVFLDDEIIKGKVGLFRNEWQKYSEKFFEGLRNIGLEFSRNRIEVYIVSATTRDMSAPLIIRARYDEKEFVNVLSHELLHNLFNDIGLVKEYAGESETTRRHVYLFAVLEYLFRDVFGEPERLETEQAKSGPQKNSDYYRAWQIVERDGYKSILKKMKHTR